MLLGGDQAALMLSPEGYFGIYCLIVACLIRMDAIVSVRIMKNLDTLATSGGSD